MNTIWRKRLALFRSPEGLSEGPVDVAEDFGGSEDNDALTDDAAEDALASLFNEEHKIGGREGGEDGTAEGRKGSEEGHEEGHEGAEAGKPDDGNAEGKEPAEGEKPDPQASGAGGLSDDLTLDINGTSVKLGELKALAGQAINLHTKGQEIAQQQQEVATLKADYSGRLTKQKEFVDGLFSDLAGVDMASIKANSSPEEWAKFSKYAESVVKLHGELSEGVEAITPEVQKAQQEADYKAAQACAQALTDPATGIPGYTQERHNANEEFAQKMGLSKDITESLTDPSAWKLIEYAHKYAELQDKASKVVPKPTVQAPKTPALKNEGQDGQTGGKATDALRRLRQTGSEDDAVAALMQLGL